MTAPEDKRDAQRELELFRQAAEELGFGSADLDGRTDRLETANEFIARMKAEDRAVARPHARRRWALVTVGGIAASAALVFGIARPGGDTAAAEAPPVLDFEFAAATRISYAPGEDPVEGLTLLEEAAGSMAASPGQGEIQYRKTDNWYAELDDNGTSKIVPRVNETWLRPDGSLTTHEAVGQPLSADGRGVVASEGDQVVNETQNAGSVDADFSRNLPTSPGKLASALLDNAQCESRSKGDTRSMCLYRQIVNLNQTYVVSARLTQTIWRMLQSESGFRNLGSVQDRAGRDAIAISIISSDEPQVRHLLLGSLEDGRYLGYEDILIRRDPNLDVKPPSVLTFSTSLESRFTATAPE